MWKYKLFVIDRHQVWALESKDEGIQVGSREILFTVYDVALVMRLLATGKQVMFE